MHAQVLGESSSEKQSAAAQAMLGLVHRWRCVSQVTVVPVTLDAFRCSMISVMWHLQVEVWPPAAPRLASGHKRRSEEPEPNDHTVSSSFLYEGQEAAASSPRPDKLIKTGSAHHNSAHPSQMQSSAVQHEMRSSDAQHDLNRAEPSSHSRQGEQFSAAAVEPHADGLQTGKAGLSGAGHATGRHQQPLGGVYQPGAHDRAGTGLNAGANIPGSTSEEAADEAAAMDVDAATETIAKQGVEPAQRLAQHKEHRQADSLTARQDDTASASIGESDSNCAAQSLQ